MSSGLDGAFRTRKREAGQIDGHHDVWPLRLDVGGSLSDAAFQKANARQDLQKAHDRQVAIGKQARRPSSAMRGAADAGECHIGPTAAMARISRAPRLSPLCSPAMR